MKPATTPSKGKFKRLKLAVTAVVLLLGGLELANWSLGVYRRYHLNPAGQAFYQQTGIRVYADPEAAPLLRWYLPSMAQAIMHANVTSNDLKYVYRMGTPKWWVPSHLAAKLLRPMQVGRYLDHEIVLRNTATEDDFFHELMHAKLGGYPRYEELQRDWMGFNESPYLSPWSLHQRDIPGGTAGKTDVEAKRLGYWSHYGRTSFEEDFCELISAAANSPRYVGSSIEHPIIRKKLELAQHHGFLPADWFRYAKVANTRERKEAIIRAADEYLQDPGPSEAHVRYHRAGALLDLDQFKAAEEEYKRVLRITTSPPLYRLTLCQLRTLFARLNDRAAVAKYSELETRFNERLYRDSTVVISGKFKDFTEEDKSVESTDRD